MKMIEVENFSKSFGSKLIIDDLSFDVSQGEIFAFLGSNGAGKTTTIRCLLGIYQASQGVLKIKGEPYSWKQSASLGYLPEERGLYLSSQVLETMVYFGQLKGLSDNQARQWSEDYLKKVDLWDKKEVEIKKLSSGQQQKIQLGITIINKPELLILDEPTKGLDPVNRSLLMEMLLDLNANGSTILMSSHHMQEIEQLSPRLLLLKDGKRVLYGSLPEIKKSFEEEAFILEYEGQVPKSDGSFEVVKLQKLDQVKILLSSKTSFSEVIKSLSQQKGLQIISLRRLRPSLEEIFVKISKEQESF